MQFNPRHLAERDRRGVDQHRNIQQAVQHVQKAGQSSHPSAEALLQVGVAGRSLQLEEHRQEHVHHEDGHDQTGDGAGPVLDAVPVHLGRDAQHRDGGDVAEITKLIYFDSLKL